MTALSAPERIGRDLTRAILRGTHAPGTHLPTLRHLAADYGVNPATMQRALARLEARGLVTARQGSGLRVNDPAEGGDLSLVPELLAAWSDDPDRSAAVLDELLEVRRVLAARLVVRHRDAVLSVLDEIEAEVSGGIASADDPDAVRELDLAVARRILTATVNTVVLALLASLERALVELPELVAAMYEDPARTLDSTLAVAGAIRAGGPALGERIDEILGDVDHHTVAAYRRRLRAHA